MTVSAKGISRFGVNSLIPLVLLLRWEIIFISTRLSCRLSMKASTRCQNLSRATLPCRLMAYVLPLDKVPFSFSRILTSISLSPMCFTKVLVWRGGKGRLRLRKRTLQISGHGLKFTMIIIKIHTVQQPHHVEEDCLRT